MAKTSGLKIAPPGHHNSKEDRRADAAARKFAAWERGGRHPHGQHCNCGLPQEHRRVETI